MYMLRHKFWLYPALVADLGHLSQLAVCICVDMSDGQAMVRTEMTEMEACGEFYLTTKARAVSVSCDVSLSLSVGLVVAWLVQSM